MQNSSFLAQALGYGARGWPVFPCRPQGKFPLIAKWPSRSSIDPKQITSWWSRWPRANIAITTGQRSGLLVLDVDGDPRELLAGRLLPPTVAQRTGSGNAWQFLYQWRPELARYPTTRARLLPNVDTRGDGGYVIAPPSIHPSGRPYAWAPGMGPGEAELADPPHWLIELLRKRPSGTGTPREEWRRIAAEKCPRGARNQTLARLVGHLLRRDVDPIMARELALAWSQARCVPPMEPEEALRTVESIARRELSRRWGGEL